MQAYKAPDVGQGSIGALPANRHRLEEDAACSAYRPWLCLGPQRQEALPTQGVGAETLMSGVKLAPSSGLSSFGL